MVPLRLYAVGALALIVAIFWVVRKIPAFATLSSGVVLAFAAATVARGEGGHVAEWVLAVVGLLLCAFGLLIVRVMLIRSVSLKLLAHIDSGRPQTIAHDIGGRVHDMAAFSLVRGMPEGMCRLTPFGRFVGGVATFLYSAFRIDT
jgi:hypothetical protein